ncbi:MAG: 30S ribosomal protein S20 [Gammaproteobacteria bacterium]|nr:30S ribosomal protein S20 [Gammaproteobacteria bacterium]
MANSPQAKKRARQSEKRRAQNASQRSTVRTYIKRVLGAVEAKDTEAASGALVLALPMIDKMVTKGIMHKNQAARHKSRLTKKVKALNSPA